MLRVQQLLPLPSWYLSNAGNLLTIVLLKAAGSDPKLILLSSKTCFEKRFFTTNGKNKGVFNIAPCTIINDRFESEKNTFTS